MHASSCSLPGGAGVEHHTMPHSTRAAAPQRAAALIRRRKPKGGGKGVALPWPWPGLRNFQWAHTAPVCSPLKTVWRPAPTAAHDHTRHASDCGGHPRNDRQAFRPRGLRRHLPRDPQRLPQGRQPAQARHRPLQGRPRCLRRCHRHLHQVPLRVNLTLRCKRQRSNGARWITNQGPRKSAKLNKKQKKKTLSLASAWRWCNPTWALLSACLHFSKQPIRSILLTCAGHARITAHLGRASKSDEAPKPHHSWVAVGAQTRIWVMRCSCSDADHIGVRKARSLKFCFRFHLR